MKGNLLLAVSLALVLAIVGLCGCSPSNTTLGEINLNSQQEGIWVAGQGKVTAVPDLVILRLGVVAQEVSVAEAQTQAAEAMIKVMAALTDSDVAEKDIQTQYFSIRQVTRWDRETEQEVVIGYRVTNKVTAKIRDIDRVGSIIDAVAEAGGDLTRIDSIDFSVDDPSAYYEEARGKAMADAKAKAEQLAELGMFMCFWLKAGTEGIQIPPIYPRMYETAGAAPVPETPISPGEMEIPLTVQVAYSIIG